MSARSFLRIFILFIFCQLNLFCSKKTDDSATKPDCPSYSIPSDSYVFTVLPGTPTWVALGTVDARVKANQIPDSILAKISTAALVQSWLDFPFNEDIFAASNLQSGMDYWLANFSGLLELKKRTDAAKTILARYQFMNPPCIDYLSPGTDKGGFSGSFIIMELLLSQDVFLNGAPIDVKKNVVAEGLKKYSAKKNYNNAYYYAGGDLASSLFLCGRVMKNAGYQPFLNAYQASTVLQQFLTTGYFSTSVSEDNPDIKILLQQSSDFIK